MAKVMAIAAMMLALSACDSGRVTGSASWAGEVTAEDGAWALHIDSADVGVTLATMTPAAATDTATPTLAPTASPTATATQGAGESVTVELPSIAAGFMNANLPTIPIDGGAFVATGYFSTPQTDRALIQFNVTGIDPGATVAGAALRLNVYGNYATTAHTVGVYRVGRRWTRGITQIGSWAAYRQDRGQAWAAGGASGAGDRDAATIGSLPVSSATTGSVTIPLDAGAVGEWVTGVYPNNGIIMVADNETAQTMMRWRAMAASPATLRPTLIVTYTTPGHALTDDLEAYWTLDDSTYADATGNGHTLTAGGAPSQTDGRIGGAARFNVAEQDWLWSHDAALKPGDEPWTFAAWVRLTDNVPLYDVAGNRGSDDRGWNLIYHGVNILDYYVLQLNDDGSASGTADKIIADTIGYTGGNPALNQWEFIVTRHDATRRHALVSRNASAPSSSGSHFGGEWGNSNYHSVYPGAPVASSGAFTLGRITQLTRFFQGDLDEVGYWRRYLSDAEIETLYNGGAGLRPMGGE